MKRLRCVRQVVLWVVCLIGTAGMALGQDKALKLLPDNSLMCIKLNNLNQTLTQLDSFLTGVSPVLPAMIIRGQLMRVLGNPTLAGLDQQGSFVLFMLPAVPPSAGQPQSPLPVTPGLLVPVSAYKDFISGSKACSEPNDGIALMTVQGLPPLQIVPAGDFALMAPKGMVDIKTLKQQLRLKGGASLGQSLSASATKEASGHSLWGYANLKQLNAMFGPMLQMKAKSAEQAMKANMKQPGMAQIFKMMDSALTLLNQMGSATLSLNIKPTALNVTSSLSSLPGSALAQTLDTKGQPGNLDNMMGMMDPSGLMSGVMRFDANQIAGIIKLFLGQSTDPNSLAFWKRYQSVGTGSMVANATVAKNAAGKPGMAMSYLFQVQNPQALADIMAKPDEMMKAMGMDELLKISGAKLEISGPKPLFTYQGVQVKSITEKVVYADPNSPQSKMAGTFDANTDMRYAIVDKTLVTAAGPGCDDRIKPLIDTAKKGVQGSVSPELKTLLAYLSDSRDVDFLGTYNYAKLMDLMTGILPISIPQTGIPVKTPLVLAGKCRQGTAYGELAVPKQNLQEVMQFVQMMMAQKMQQQQQQSQTKPQPQTPPQN